MCNIEYIRKASKNHERSRANDVICSLIQSEKVTCEKTFERLCSNYIAGSDEFREGMDKATQEFLGINLEELCYEVMKEEA